MPHGEPRVTFQWLLLCRLVAGAVRLPVGVLQGMLQAQLVAHLEGLPHRAHHPHRLALRSKPVPLSPAEATLPPPLPPHCQWENWEPSPRFPSQGCPALLCLLLCRAAPALPTAGHNTRHLPGPLLLEMSALISMWAGADRLRCCPGSWARRGQAPGTFFWGHPALALPRSLPRDLHPLTQRSLWLLHGKVQGPSETSRLGRTRPQPRQHPTFFFDLKTLHLKELLAPSLAM